MKIEIIEHDTFKRLKMVAQKADEESRKKAENSALVRPIRLRRTWNIDDGKRENHK